MLKQRIITALIMLPIALCGFFLLEGASFALFIGAVVVVGAWEWARMAQLGNPVAPFIYAAGIALVLMGLYHMPGAAPWVLMAAACWWVLAIFLVMTYPASSEHWAGRVAKLLIGLFILLPAWQGLVLIKQWPLGNLLILAVMVLVWGADIGAYFSGKALGKRKLAPRVSPGKSWEGMFGGLLTCLVITGVVGLVRGWSLHELLLGLGGAAVVVLISVVGDLTESMFKRKSGMKDSSNLLPGHGGVLDRIDSLTAAVPVYALLLWAVGWGVL